LDASVRVAARCSVSVIDHGENAVEIRIADENLLTLWPAVRVAPQVGAGLGAREILLRGLSKWKDAACRSVRRLTVDCAS